MEKTLTKEQQVKKLVETIEKLSGKKVVYKEANWDVKVPAKEKGKYKDSTIADLTTQRNALKAKETRTAEESGKLKELDFAIRAKSNWGKVKENVEESTEAKLAAQIILEAKKDEDKDEKDEKEEDKETEKEEDAPNAKDQAEEVVTGPTAASIIPGPSIKIIQAFVDTTLSGIDASTKELKELKKKLGADATATGEDWAQKTQRLQDNITRLRRIAQFVNNTIVAQKFDKNLLDRVLNS